MDVLDERGDRVLGERTGLGTQRLPESRLGDGGQVVLPSRHRVFERRRGAAEAVEGTSGCARHWPSRLRTRPERSSCSVSIERTWPHRHAIVGTPAAGSQRYSSSVSPANRSDAATGVVVEPTDEQLTQAVRHAHGINTPAATSAAAASSTPRTLHRGEAGRGRAVDVDGVVVEEQDPVRAAREGVPRRGRTARGRA